MMNITNEQLQALKDRYNGGLYFYTGFNAPKEIDVEDFKIESNYGGDVTELVIEEMLAWLSDNDSDIIENQPFFVDAGIWFKPTIEDLRDFNKSVGLKEDEYLNGFIV